ncbi:MAG: aldehyde dehydrogenase family protein [Janthinobacterium lividum]
MAYARVNPAPASRSRTSRSTPAEVEAALSTAHDAYGRWRRLSYSDRAKIVGRAADLMRERVDEFLSSLRLNGQGLR